MGDDIVAEFRAFDFGGAFHEAGEIIGDAFGRDCERLKTGGLNRRLGDMSREQILKEAMALPLEDRVDVAQALWGSIAERGGSAEDEAASIALAKERDTALRDGAVTAVSHDEVMTRARRALGCE